MFALRSYFNRGINIVIPLEQQSRNTYILRRRHPIPLHKKGGLPIKMKGRHFIYDLEQGTGTVKQPNLNIILNQYVEGIGNAGDLLSVRPMVAYRDYLMPGLAVYANPDNREKFKVDENKPKPDALMSSPYVQRTINCLSRTVLQITMSKMEPWTLEKWHVRASFRKTGYVVPEEAITMPSIQIKGPDLSLQDKEFYVTVTINKKEKVNVRCRIHHWATGLDRLPWDAFHWKKPCEALIPEQAAELEKMPLPE